MIKQRWQQDAKGAETAGLYFLKEEVAARLQTVCRDVPAVLPPRGCPRDDGTHPVHVICLPGPRLTLSLTGKQGTRPEERHNAYRTADASQHTITRHKACGTSSRTAPYSSTQQCHTAHNTHELPDRTVTGLLHHRDEEVHELHQFRPVIPLAARRSVRQSIGGS